MSSFLVYFKNSYSIIILAILLSIVFTFVTTKLSDKEADKSDYINSIFIVTLVSLLTIYINGLKGSISEEVLTGIAPF